MKAEEGEHREHDDDETYEIDDTVHGSGSLLPVERFVEPYVPFDKRFGMGISCSTGSEERWARRSLFWPGLTPAIAIHGGGAAT
ncbi:hypothetical protein, partial [Mesorhizobium sp. M1C.F.Ca.ET.196.01.1.1]|uniref:hypothetical protein n=1 Tax=Mesorhizobium sp. M1C.F.Ca.ET.196.01.1.1 TaxID=2563928 RepID=UPI001AEE0BB6